MLTRAKPLDRSMRAALEGSLRDLDASALQISALRVGGASYVAATAVDADGHAHLVGMRVATPSFRAAASALFSELLARGLRAKRPLLVGVDGCDALAQQVRAAFGTRAVLHVA